MFSLEQRYQKRFTSVFHVENFSDVFHFPMSPLAFPLTCEKKSEIAHCLRERFELITFIQNELGNISLLRNF